MFQLLFLSIIQVLLHTDSVYAIWSFMIVVVVDGILSNSESSNFCRSKRCWNPEQHFVFINSAHFILPAMFMCSFINGSLCFSHITITTTGAGKKVYNK